MRKSPIRPHLVSVCELSEAHIPHILDYWFFSPPGYIESMGVDMAKMPSKRDMHRLLQERCEKQKTETSTSSPVLISHYDGRPVGIHSLNPLEPGVEGVFHAHIFRLEMRGRGISAVTYPRACKVFMERFRLQRILFKTPAQNQSAIRVKEKLGIRCIGNETIGFGIIREGTQAKVFEVTSQEINQLFPD